MTDWNDLLPPGTALMQTGFERAGMIYRARQKGAKFTDIAKSMGVTIERVRHIYWRYVRQISGPNPAPIQRYFDEPITIDDDRKFRKRESVRRCLARKCVG